MHEITVELEGRSVFVDDVRLTALDVEPAGAPSELSLPSVEEAPTIDGVETPGEWEHATWLTGFANLSTGSLVLRQGRVGLSSDGEKLFVCARWLAQHGTVVGASPSPGDSDRIVRAQR